MRLPIAVGVDGSRDEGRRSTGWLRRRRAVPDVVDLRPVELGRPGPCPRCGGPGYLDHLDLAHDSQRQHCRRCSHEWELRFLPSGDLVTIQL